MPINARSENKLMSKKIVSVFLNLRQLFEETTSMFIQ